MTATSGKVGLFRIFRIVVAVVWVCLCVSVLSLAQQSTAKKSPAATNPPTAGPSSFDTPQLATDALVDAADKFDVVALARIFGPGGEHVVFSGEFAQDRKHAADFAAEARGLAVPGADRELTNWTRFRSAVATWKRSTITPFSHAKGTT